jgi:hypothetical protein
VKFAPRRLTLLQVIDQVVVQEMSDFVADDIAELIEKKGPTSHEAKCMVFCIQRKFGVVSTRNSSRCTWSIDLV